MTLATADADGSPWASPVWFATADHHEFVWVSKPGARHSRNLAARSEIAIVVFDSHQRPGTGEAVYVSARAEQVPDADLERCLDIFAAASGHRGSRTGAAPTSRRRPVIGSTAPRRASTSCSRGATSACRSRCTRADGRPRRVDLRRRYPCAVRAPTRNRKGTP